MDLEKCSIIIHRIKEYQEERQDPTGDKIHSRMHVKKLL